MEIRTTVMIESPYAGDIERNVAYARRCLLHSIRNDEVPFASHLIYPQVLSEDTERELGIELGYAWLATVDLQAFYVDLGWSDGMLAALEMGQKMGVPYEERRLR